MVTYLTGESKVSNLYIPKMVVRRFQQAINQHDLDKLVESLHAEYNEEKPLFPGNYLLDREQTRQQWRALFARVPNLRAEDEQWRVQDEIVWTQWRWYGKEISGKRFELAGTTLFGIEANQILWGRFSLFPVKQFRFQSCTTLEDIAAWRRLVADPRWQQLCY
jgi:hypothetical protein